MQRSLSGERDPMGTNLCDLLHLQHLRVLVRPDLFSQVMHCEVGMEISGSERHCDQSESTCWMLSHQQRQLSVWVVQSQ